MRESCTPNVSLDAEACGKIRGVCVFMSGWRGGEGTATKLMCESCTPNSTLNARASGVVVHVRVCKRREEGGEGGMMGTTTQLMCESCTPFLLVFVQPCRNAGEQPIIEGHDGFQFVHVASSYHAVGEGECSGEDLF